MIETKKEIKESFDKIIDLICVIVNSLESHKKYIIKLEKRISELEKKNEA